MYRSKKPPLWYSLFSRVSGPLWLLGTAVGVLGWMKIVDNDMMWLGIYLSGGVTIGAILLPGLAGIRTVVSMSDAMIESQDFEYFDVIRKFRRGALLQYGDLAFMLFPKQAEVACGLANPSDTDELDEQTVRDCASYALGVFEQLREASAEFAGSVDGYDIRVSLMSGLGPDARELCCIKDGQLTWFHAEPDAPQVD